MKVLATMMLVIALAYGDDRKTIELANTDPAEDFPTDHS